MARRHAQRHTLRYGADGPPPTVMLSAEERPGAYESRSQRDLELYQDSGYNSLSESDPDDEAMFYQQKMDEFEEEGATLSNPCDETKAMMAAVEKNWGLFCKATKIKNPQAALIECEARTIKGYLFWRVKNSRIKKESSIITCWKVLSMVYARLAQRYMDGGVLYDIRNWIPQKLTPMFGLDDSEKDKAGLFVEDLCTLQNGHWVLDTEVYAHERLRVQLSPLLIIAGCTATRPKALVGKRPLLYKDIEFQVFPPSIKERPPIIVMILNLKHIKRSGGKSKKKIFAFYEGEDLSCCVVTFMLALALADNAFENKFTLKDIYTWIVPPDTDRIRLYWDDKWAERPVFRDVEHTAKGVRMSKTQSLQYSKHRHHFIRVGRTCGFEKRLEFYDLRRASGKRLNEELTPEERRQIMGNQGDVYERYYMPAFIDRDCQAIYLGSTRRDDLIRAVGRLARHARAPPALTDVQNQEIKLHGYRTIKAAKGTELFELHKETQADINNLKRKLSDALLNKTIKEFHISVHTDEVNQQMQGIRPSDILTPPTIKYELEERAAVAKLLFMPLDNLSEDQIRQVRIEVVENLAQLCKRQETPHLYKAPKSRGQRPKHPIDLPILPPASPEDFRKLSRNEPVVIPQLQGPVLICAFCKWCDEEAGPAKKDKVFARIDILRKHVRTQHLDLMASDTEFSCPYEGCLELLAGTMHYLNHVTHGHGLYL
ncbi:hypothetical protein V501_03678 [Pseudogymnoascus sp. VKM F-4519 (FW-2642)]|nr:hypothetical protein V501_03678 [Pseudogymnoascus sp. VKM F-4519 (FW-2642)]